MKKKITVIGDVMIDWYLHGESSRISPEAPVPVVNFKESKFQLGGAANVANNLKHLEIEPFLIGAVGKDHFGSLLKEHLKVEKIKFNLLSEKSFESYDEFRERVRTAKKKVSSLMNENRNSVIGILVVSVNSCSLLQRLNIFGLIERKYHSICAFLDMT